MMWLYQENVFCNYFSSTYFTFVGFFPQITRVRLFDVSMKCLKTFVNEHPFNIVLETLRLWIRWLG